MLHLKSTKYLLQISPSLLSRLQTLLNLHTTSSPIHHHFPSKTLENQSFRISNTLASSQPQTETQTLHFDSKSVEQTLTTYTNDWKRALEFFNWVENECQFQHNLDTYNRMIDISGKFFEFDLAWSLFHRLLSNNHSPNHTTFRILFNRYAAAHMVKEAIDTFNRLDEFGFKDETSLSCLIDALCEYKHVIEAEEFCFGKDGKTWMMAQLNFDIRNKTKLYNMMLRGWLKMGWWRKCRDFWEEMEEKGVERDLHSYTIYMDIVCKSGKAWKAIKLYKEMKKKRIQLDVVSYNVVINAIGISEGVDQARNIYREMVELGCKPNIVTYNTIMKLLCKEGRWRDAYLLLDKMPEKGCEPNVITYHCFFGCLTNPKKILKLFDRMFESDIYPRMDTYVMLMTKFARWGFLRPVFIVWKKMEEQGCSPDAFAYNALIDALIQKNMIDMARKYDEEMLAKGLSPKPRKELGTKIL